MISEPDTGPYHAFNKGLRLATGDVIGFLNCGDTYIDPYVLDRVAAAMKSDSVDAVFSDLDIVDPENTEKVARRYRSKWFRSNRVRYGLMPAHPTLFLRSSTYERFGPYDESYRIAGDFELVARIFAVGGASYTYIPDVLVKMLKGGLSTSGLQSNWTITREMRRACRQNDIDTNLAKLLFRIPFKLTEVVF